MKCLSLWQPWASLLVHGRKQVEARGWALRHRGPLLIHAALRWKADEREMWDHSHHFVTALTAIGETTAAAPKPDCTFVEMFGCRLPLGAIVGRVEVVAVYPTERVGSVDNDSAPIPMQMPGDKLYVGETERAFGDYSPGRFAWLCENFTPFAQPIPFRGAQGLFDVPDHILAGLGT